MSLVKFIWVEHIWILNHLDLFDRLEIWRTVKDRFEAAVAGGQIMV
jgi:hypothetical protein